MTKKQAEQIIADMARRDWERDEQPDDIRARIRHAYAHDWAVHRAAEVLGVWDPPPGYERGEREVEDIYTEALAALTAASASQP